MSKLLQSLFPRESDGNNSGARNSSPSTPVSAAPAAPAASAAEDDAEIIAVIAAAVAAVTGQSADSFVIRRINRVSGFVPIWNRLGQLECLDSRRM